jgi:hypothetical protein
MNLSRKDLAGPAELPDLVREYAGWALQAHTGSSAVCASRRRPRQAGSFRTAGSRTYRCRVTQLELE